MSERKSLQRAITALEAQRAALGDDIVETSIQALREKLAALPMEGAQQQRKQVTVLFADVADFTRMSEMMDAEDVMEMMNALWQHLDLLIAEHGGTIDKHIGDAVMALWGTGQSREDDAEQAIRTALAIHQTLTSLDFTRELPEPLQMRIGVHTGPVILGEMGTVGEYTAMGDTVNATQRLQEATPAGETYISHATYRHVRGVFNVRALEPLDFKGRVASLRAYRVLSAKPRAFRTGTRGVEGIETHLIGREQELEQLKATLQTTIERGQRHVVRICGEAGIGKSRLLYAFDNWLELIPEVVRFFKGRALRRTQTIPYALIHDVLAFRFQIREHDSPDVVQEKLVRGFRMVMPEAPDVEMRAHFTGYFLGFNVGSIPYLAGVGSEVAGTEVRDRVLAYLGDYFKAISKEPTVIFLEDMQWADESSLVVLRHLLEVLAQRPVLFVCTGRTAFFVHHPAWCVEMISVALALEPLSEEESRALVDEILKKVEHLPDVLRMTIVERAAGNPFYVEEFVKMFIDTGVIVKDEPYWRVSSARLAEAEIPCTLTALLQARLDRLPDPALRLLQYASVVGRIFWGDVVHYLAEESGQPVLQSAGEQDPLLTLVDREMVFQRRTSTFSGTEEYIFKNNLLRETTYAGVLKRERRICHERVAAWLIERTQEQDGKLDGMIAVHLERAGDIARAVIYLQRVGRQALRLSAYREAYKFFSRAVDLLSEREEPARIEAHLGLSEALFCLGEYEEARASLDLALTLSRNYGDVGQRIAALRQLGRIAHLFGAYTEAADLLGKGLALARKSGELGHTARLLIDLGLMDISLGALERARDRFSESVEIYRALGDDQGLAFAFNRLGASEMVLKQYEAAQRYLQESLQLSRRIGQRRGVAGALANLGETARVQENYAEARQHFEEALAAFRELGVRRGVVITLANLGHVTAAQGDYAPAQTYYNEALQITAQMGLAPQMLDILAGMARPVAYCDSPVRALELLGLALHHEALSEETRLLIAPLLEELREQLPVAVVEDALERGAGLELNALVNSLLDG